MVKVALIGAGDRGKDRYGKYILESNEIEIVAVAEPNAIKRAEASLKHKISREMQFESWEKLLELDKFCDGIIIATSDDLHFQPAIQALEKDYHILLEKPMSNNLDEVIAIGEAEKKSKGDVMVCHVLRYTPFYSKLKSLIDSKEIGDVVSIQHNENIGYYHFAHSFVRGNWRNAEKSSPLILAKSCHDMDILLWLAGDKCNSISSYGSLNFFKEENQYENAADRCFDCNIHLDCEFSAQKHYLPNIGKWPSSTIVPVQTENAINEVLKHGPYGRCVFKCDNDVVDNQVTILKFDNNVTSTFNLCAFTNDISRTIKIMGTKGEIRGKDTINEIEVNIFGKTSIKLRPEVLEGGHGGGDTGIMNDFVSLLKGSKTKSLTSASISVESHVMSFAAEHSRTIGDTVNVEKFWNERK